MKAIGLGVLLTVLLASCGSGGDRSRLCADSFEPYVDLVSTQNGDERSADYIAAMTHYSAGRYAEAELGLKAYIDSRRDFQKGAHLYLAISQLANGKPYDAELSLDKLRHSTVKGFADQCGWYTVLCWLCSEQWPRALEGAKAIAATQRHTYRKQAAALAERLERAGTE